VVDKTKIRIGRLDSVGGVVKEMARCYREARRGTLETKEMGRLVYALTQIRQAIEGSELEARISELERRE